MVVQCPHYEQENRLLYQCKGKLIVIQILQVNRVISSGVNLWAWNLECEEHVSTTLPKNVRSLIAQFRCGILPLEIEIGRYRNIPVENRTCSFCINQIEDEFHVLCQCPVYDDLRDVLYTQVIMDNSSFANSESIEKTYLYFKSNHQILLGKFLDKAVKHRTELSSNLLTDV